MSGKTDQLQEIYFTYSATDKKDMDAIALLFSEPVDVATVFSQVLVRDQSNGTLLDLELATPKGLNTVVGVKHGGGFKPAKSYQIEIGTNMGVAKRLDSKYEGKEGTEAFKVVLRPEDHDHATRWAPGVTP